MENNSAHKPLRFSRNDPKKFFQILNKRVNEHFQKRKKTSKAPKQISLLTYLNHRIRVAQNTGNDS